MTKKRITNIKELSKQVNFLLKDILNDDNNLVASVIKETESDMVEQEVYAKYQSNSLSPYKYMRRGADDWGLADTRNMKHETVYMDDKVKMTVKNTAKGVSGHKGEKALKEGELAQLVEGGHGTNGLKYSYGNGSEEYFEPRPFQEKTLKELSITKAHTIALATELQRKSIKTKL